MTVNTAVSSWTGGLNQRSIRTEFTTMVTFHTLYTILVNIHWTW